MAKDDLAQIEGVVIDALAGGNYTVKLENAHIINAKISGKMRKYNIRVIVGDRVTVGVSPYDPTHGLIIHRHKAGYSAGGGGTIGPVSSSGSGSGTPPTIG